MPSLQDEEGGAAVSAEWIVAIGQVVVGFCVGAVVGFLVFLLLSEAGKWIRRRLPW